MSCDVGEVTERLESSFSNISITSPTPQLILQPFRSVAVALPLPVAFCMNASPASQALHLIHLASRPCCVYKVTWTRSHIEGDWKMETSEWSCWIGRRKYQQNDRDIDYKNDSGRIACFWMFLQKNVFFFTVEQGSSTRGPRRVFHKILYNELWILKLESLDNYTNKENKFSAHSKILNNYPKLRL